MLAVNFAPYMNIQYKAPGFIRMFYEVWGSSKREYLAPQMNQHAFMRLIQKHEIPSTPRCTSNESEYKQ